MKGEPLPCSHNRNKSLQGRAGQSPGAGQAGCVLLLTPKWLSLCAFIPALLQSIVGDSGRINHAPSLKALSCASRWSLTGQTR